MVDVLVFIHEHVIETAADLCRESGLLHQRMPVQEQVVVVERAIFLLACDVLAEQPTQFLDPILAPGESSVQHFLERAPAIHAMRIDREAGVLSRESSLLRRQPAFMAQEIDQVGGIAAIQHAEIRRDAERRRMFAQQPVCDGMKCAGPWQPHRGGQAVHCALAQRLADDPFRAARHLHRRPARECEEQDPRRIDALDHELGDAMRQGVGLAGASARDHEQRRRREWLPGAALAE